MTIQDVVAAFQRSDLGTVKIDTMKSSGTRLVGCVSMDFKTSDFEARGLVPAYMDLCIATHGYLTAHCWDGTVAFRVIWTSDKPEEAAWAKEQELLAEAARTQAAAVPE